MTNNKIIFDLYDDDECNYKTNEFLITNISNATCNKNSCYYNIYINLDLLGIEKIDHSSKALNRIVYYAMKIAGHMPASFEIPSQATFWNKTIMPMINRTMFHEAKARQIIRKGFDIISSLANNTIDCYSISIYNQDHIKIFKNKILYNLKLLNMSCNQVTSLTSESWLELSKFSEKIVNMIGSEAALYMDKQALLETKIKQYQLKQNKLKIELDYKKGKLVILEKRKENLSKQIEIINKERQSISNKINVLSITRNWLKKLRKKQLMKSSSYNKLTIFNNCLLKIKVKLVEHKNENFQFSSKLCDLNAKLDSNSEEFEKLKTYVDSNEPDFEQNITNYEQKIGSSRIEIDKILSRKEFVQNNIGLNGSVLIQFLTYLRLFAMEILKTTAIYSTINSILNEIKSSIQCPIELLNSASFANVLIGHKMLYSQAHSLLAYSRDARKSIANNHHKRCWLIDINNNYKNN